MLVLVIDSKEYKAFDNWNQMPLSIAVKLHSLLTESMPAALKAFYELKAVGGEDYKEAAEAWQLTVTDEDVIKLFPVFYGKAMAILTTVPEDIIDHIGRETRFLFYKKYCESFVFGILHYTEYKIENIKSFNHNGIELFLPETKEVMGKTKPFFDRSAIEFTESADLELFSKQMTGGKYEVAANIISILCRPKIKTPENGSEYLEPYNEETCLLRAKEFSELPMNIVFEVFFCLAQHLYLSQQITAICSLKEVVRLQRKSATAE